MQYSSLAMLACGTVAWFMLKWYFQTHIDDQILYVSRNKITLFLLVFSYVLMFYFFVLLSVLALIAGGLLVKIMLLDFFGVTLDPDLFRNMLNFVTSREHVIFNVTVTVAFATMALFSIVTKDTTQNSDPASMRAMLSNLLLLFLAFYLVAGGFFVLKHL